MLKSGVMLAGRYEIVGRVGSGGMADVYKARDHKLNRFVAVKVMKPEFQGDSTFISKFRREAQAAAGLANPNIVNVYDVGEDQGSYYIVMELVEGITLKEYITKKGKLSVREATSIAIQVAMGLAAAHDQGIVHRDVKPQNIIISTEGKVKVTDFGIARAASSNTISANAMGSVHYSSPEQVRGGYSDARSDIYSLGITLYEMVTGRVPFDGETTVAIAIKHLQDEMEPPSKYAPDLPYSLEQIIYKCTQKSVDRRYQSMNDVITDLKRSLMEPDGDFVQIAPLTDRAQTVMVSPAEQAAIRAAGKNRTAAPKNRTPETQPTRTPTYSSIENARKGIERDEEDDDDESLDDDRGGSTGLERAVTIGSFIVCALIICILIYFIGQAVGLFGSGSSSSATTASGTNSVMTTNSAVSDGIEVPSLIGMTESEAEATATAKGLGIKYQGEEASDEAAGTIIAQNPTAGTTVEKNTTIYYTRSSGPETYTIPSGIVGSSSADAQAALTAAGFTNITTETAASDSVASGNVISVAPEEGTATSAADTQVTLTVSSGESESSGVNTDVTGPVSVPNYRGISLESARSSAEERGLVVNVTYTDDDSVGVGEVASQSPEAHTEVEAGSTLTLTVNDPSQAGTTTGTGTEETGTAGTETAGTTESASGTQSGATGTETTGTDNTQANAGSSWVCIANLGAAPNYTGGAYRLVLVQNVNGSDVETTIEESSSTLQFPYLLQINGAEGVSTGTVYLYEYDSSTGDYVPRVTWDVTFTEQS